MSFLLKIYSLLLATVFLLLWSKRPYLFYQPPLPLDQEVRGEKITVDLGPVNESTVSGQAYFQDVNGMLEIYISVNADPQSRQPASLVAGSCESQGAKKYQLWTLFGGRVRATSYTLKVVDLARQAPVSLVVYADHEEQKPISCGQLPL